MKLASIERIKKVTKHNNADSLDIVEVLGFNVIVKLGQFKENDLVVFIQPDTILPNEKWAEFYKAKSSRVKAIKLRQVWSQGIIESLSILPSSLENFKEGDEVSQVLDRKSVV